MRTEKAVWLLIGTGALLWWLKRKPAPPRLDTMDAARIAQGEAALAEDRAIADDMMRRRVGQQSI